MGSLSECMNRRCMKLWYAGTLIKLLLVQQLALVGTASQCSSMMKL
uniref:Uncharacterized protein n=1 Tax=Picea glauca TaxID=3330 RepID=A0A124GN55_PICGL|nr:hypothetical protein ABT39_MTgene5905 [Picea glauca]QHR92068.1 hypothetical protein Q903MT_gene6104 [Picea sitchensis]